MLEEYRKEEGLFLVRKSTRNETYNVISLCHKKSIFNFEIKVKVGTLTVGFVKDFLKIF